MALSKLVFDRAESGSRSSPGITPV